MKRKWTVRFILEVVPETCYNFLQRMVREYGHEG